jgi:hypothetical protein
VITNRITEERANSEGLGISNLEKRPEEINSKPLQAKDIRSSKKSE